MFGIRCRFARSRICFSLLTGIDVDTSGGTLKPLHNQGAVTAVASSRNQVLSRYSNWVAAFCYGIAAFIATFFTARRLGRIPLRLALINA
jgi:hypothetical protein